MTKTLPGGKKPDDRLRLLIDLVGSCERVIDIGTDHALLPIRLVEEGKCGCVIAIDSSISAFKKAQRNVAKAGAGDKITVLHGSGLKNVEVKVGDTLVLAGLGGREIISILSEKLPLPGNVSIIAQAQSDLFLMRDFFASNNWEFLAEELVEAKGYIYVIVKVYTGATRGEAVAGKKSAAGVTPSGELSLLEKGLGPLLLQEWGRREPTEAEKRYLRREYTYRKSIAEPSEVDRIVLSYIESLIK